MTNLQTLAAKLPKSFTIGTDIFNAKGEGYIVKLKRGPKTGKKKAAKSPAKKAKTKGKKKSGSVHNTPKLKPSRRRVLKSKMRVKVLKIVQAPPKPKKSKKRKAPKVKVAASVVSAAAPVPAVIALPEPTPLSDQSQPPSVPTSVESAPV